MAKKKKSTTDPNVRTAEDAGREFGISLKELETLMQTRGREGMEELNANYGGLSGLGQKLKTNLITGKKKQTKISIRNEKIIYSFRFIG
jgi:hypothetical protein